MITRHHILSLHKPLLQPMLALDSWRKHHTITGGRHHTPRKHMPLQSHWANMPLFLIGYGFSPVCFKRWMLLPDLRGHLTWHRRPFGSHSAVSWRTWLCTPSANEFSWICLHPYRYGLDISNVLSADRIKHPEVLQLHPKYNRKWKVSKTELSRRINAQ